VGVLKVLEREGVRVSAISGSSAGAMVGGAYAAGVPLARIEREWLDTNLPKVARTFLPTFPRAGLSSGREVVRYLQTLIGEAQIEELPIPFAAVATDLDTGEAVVLREGPLVQAIRASGSVPGLFQPVRWQGRLLVDGGVVAPLPVKACRDLGAKIVVAVDITPRPRPTTRQQRNLWAALSHRLEAGYPWMPERLTELGAKHAQERPEERPLPGLRSLLDQTVAIMLQEIMRLGLGLWPADLVVRPKFPAKMTYLRAAEGVLAGEEAMEEAMPALRALLETQAKAGHNER
jgi:NTE family protein